MIKVEQKDFGTLGSCGFIYGDENIESEKNVVITGNLIKCGSADESDIPFVFTHTKGMRYGVDDGVGRKKRLVELGAWARKQMKGAQKKAFK